MSNHCSFKVPSISTKIYFLLTLEENVEAKTYAMIIEVEDKRLNPPSVSQLRILSVKPNCL